MTHLKQSGLIVLESKTGIGLVTPELRKIVEHEEMLTLMAPTSCVQINGPLIDRLGCLESLLMKVASVIGDVFDLQTLNKINPFKGAINYDMLSKILRELDKKDFIEIMDITENNIYYRFTALNTREVIYQRMTYSQRRELHRNVAEAIHTLPQLPDSDEKKDQYKLEFHWT
jgi:adenylate cyclase 10